MKFKIIKTNGLISTENKGIQSIKEIFQKLEDGSYYLELEKIRNKASWDQFKYYRGAIVPFIAEFMGEIFDGIPKQLITEICNQVHEMLLDKFSIKKQFKNKIDKRKMVKTLLRTSEMDSKQFTTYIDTVMIYFKNNFNLDIPKPDDNMALKFYDEQILKYGFYN